MRKILGVEMLTILVSMERMVVAEQIKPQMDILLKNSDGTAIIGGGYYAST